MTAILNSSKVLWAKAGGLAVVQGAISLMWMIYGLYLPVLLQQFGFEPTWAAGLLIVESLLAMLLEPLMGGLSDRTRHWLATRLPFVTLGIGLASVLFYSLGTFSLFGTEFTALRWLLPIILVLWSVAMAVFRSPTIGLLGRYALSPYLPQAASLLTFAGALAGTIGIFFGDFLLRLGAGTTFAIGSLFLLVAALVLRHFDPLSNSAKPFPVRTALPKLQQLLPIFLTGTAIALAVIFTRSLLGGIESENGLAPIAIVALTHIVTVIPIGFLASRVGNRQTMLGGIILGILCILFFAFTTENATDWLPAIVLGIAFSMTVNGVLPYALSMVPPDWDGLGVGTYFGGTALASVLFRLAYPDPEGATAVVLGVSSAIALAVAGFLIYTSRIYRKG